MSTPPRHPMPSRGSRQRGAVVLYIVLGLVIFGVLAAAGSTYFSSAVRGVLAPNCTAASRMMAESGLRYAAARLRAAATQAALDSAISAMNAHGAYDVGGGQSFTLSIGYDGLGNLQVNATGRGCSQSAPVNTALESVSVNTPRVGGQPPSSGIAFNNGDTPGFTPTAIIGGSGAIVVNPSGSITMGGGQFESSGSVWYSGTKDMCSYGNCTLGTGVRAYFDYVFSSTAEGDGFVWTLMSANTNTNASSGGDPARGELMGYGGPGAMGLGIQPPKLGTEFDIYYNAGNASACDVGNRNDNASDHVAFVYWGTENLACTGKSQPATYDDNRHGVGAGTSSQPRNPADYGADAQGNLGYYVRTRADNNWMQDGGQFRFRYELVRSLTPNPSGDYGYRLRGWVKKSSDTVGAGMNSTSVDFSSAPDLYQTVYFSPAVHANLSNVFFGWTEGTGAATQLVTLSNFAMNLRGGNVWPTRDFTAGWAMNEGSGTSLANANATNPVAGTILGSGTTWTSGQGCPSCTGLSFNGSGRVSVADNTSLDLTTTGAISAWIYPTALTNDTYILHKGSAADTSNEAYGLRFSTGGKLELRLRYGNTAASYIILESTALTANKWYHVVAQWDANYLYIYLNGVLNAIAANTNNRAARNTTGALVIGARHTAGAGPYLGYSGYMDEVYLYKRLLTLEEIAVMAMSLVP